MYNKVIMVGNLTRDIELRYLPSVQQLQNLQSQHLINTKLQLVNKKMKFVFRFQYFW